MRDALETLIAAWHDAWFKKDASAIAQMTAEDYVYVGPNGAVLDQAAILQIVRAPTYRLMGGTDTEEIVVMLGEDAALVRHRWQGTGTFRGQAFVDDHRCVTIWDRSSGLVAHSVRAVLGYWSVSATGSMRDRDAAESVGAGADSCSPFVA